MENNKKTILIVEDDLALLKILVDKFSHEGFSILKAKNGVEGLKSALNNHPDLILLDIIMPEMDGMTMLKYLRREEWGKNAKVILLTNLNDGQGVAEALENHTYEYLIKSDWSLESVIKKVKEKLHVQ